MKLKFVGILFATVAAFCAEADVVSSADAEAAASAFVANGRGLGLRLGTVAEPAVLEQTPDGAPFYVVKMMGGGTVITSADTDDEPVVAILPGDESFADIPANHPLRVMLNRDFSARLTVRRLIASEPLVSKSVARFRDRALRNAAQWRELVETARPRNFYTLMDAVPAINPPATPTDLRVAPLVKTRWNQSRHGENRFTPNNVVCGCVATAMAQIMRYHCWPTAFIEEFIEQCSFEGEYKPYPSIAGVFDWENMPENGGITDVEQEAIGALTYNCGVSVNMMWGMDGSGAVTSYVADALRDRFMYKSAEAAFGYNGIPMTEENQRRMIYSNLDAKSPVQFGINDSQDSSSGHSVVGDGYGFVGELSYVHINMGWGGQGDAWYHLPDIVYQATTGGAEYTADMVSTCVYNIFPEKAGYVLSGRTLDEDGAPLAFATVEITGSGIEPVIVTSSETGVWGVVLPDGGTYNVQGISADESLVGSIDEELTLDGDNSWGHDFVLSNPSVRILGKEREYSTLNRALMDTEEGDIVEIFAPTRLTAVANALAPEITIRRDETSAELTSTDVVFSAGVSLKVAANAGLRVEGITFVAANGVDRLSASVEEDGRFAVSNTVGIGLVKLIGTSSRFGLAGPLSANEIIYIETPCKGEGEAFGWYELDQTEATPVAYQILNAGDVRLGGVADEAGVLTWGITPVPDAAAVVRLKQDGDEEWTNYRSLDYLLTFFKNNAEIAVRKDVELTSAIPLQGRRLVLSGEAEFVAILGRKEMETCFTVDTGAELIVSNLTLRGFTATESFISITGGEVTMETGATLENLTSKGAHIGPVFMESGVLTMRPGSTIVGCRAMGEKGYGGGICAHGGILSLEGGTISNCYAEVGGGGVYAYVGEDAAAVRLSGEPVIMGNTSKVNGDDNLYVDDASGMVPEITGALGETTRIGISVNALDLDYEDDGNAMSNRFARIASPAVTVVSSAFVNDVNPLFGFAQDEDGNLIWSGRARPLVDPAEAALRIVDEQGEDVYFASFADVAEWVYEPCTIELLKPVVTQSEDIVFAYDVTLRSAEGVDAVLEQGFEASNSVLKVTAGTSLTLADVTIRAAGESPNHLIEVDGGALTLESGTHILGYTGTATRASSAVIVYNQGVFTMNSGSEIRNCHNTFSGGDSDISAGSGGAVLVDGQSTAYFLGGLITGCEAYYGGGVSVANESTAHVSGDFRVAGNRSGTNQWQDVSRVCNFEVEDLSALFVDAPLSGDSVIGCTIGYRLADTNLVATIADRTDWSDDDLATTAVRFYRDDDTSIRGRAVTNESKIAYIVWGTALDEVDGSYTDASGMKFFALPSADPGPDPEPEPEPDPQYAIPDPIVFTGPISSDEGRTHWTMTLSGLVKWCEYSVYGTNSLVGGFSLEAVSPVTNFQWKAEGNAVELTLPGNGENMFWRAVGKPGIIGE